MEDHKGIVIKQTVRFGQPCIKGTRVAVADILRLLQNGYAPTDVPKQYPGITMTDVQDALRYAGRIMGKEEILDVQITG